MRLPCWNFTGGAFAVFGCFGRLKCCGLIGFPWANFPFPAFWPETVAVFAWFGLPAPLQLGCSLPFIRRFGCLSLSLGLVLLGFLSLISSVGSLSRLRLLLRDRLPLTFGSSCLSGRDTLPLRFDPFWAFALPTVPSSFSWRLLLHLLPDARWPESHAGPFAPAFSVAISFLLFAHRLRR